MSEDAAEKKWNGVERRAQQQPLPQETVALLGSIHQGIKGVADGFHALADALVESADRRDQQTRRWLIGLSVSNLVTLVIVLTLVVLTLGNREQGRANFDRIDDVAARVEQVSTCIEVGGACFDRIEEREKVVTDADRKLLAQEIVCFGFGYCPPGMDPRDIPDLKGLEPVPGAPPVPGGTTTTTAPTVETEG